LFFKAAPDALSGDATLPDFASRIACQYGTG
jgi:hypothetical protein